ncbi:recombinase family protein [Trichocoleus sp. Lan]
MGRSLKHLLTLFENFNTSGIGLVSLIKAIDTTTRGGKLVCVHLGEIAEFTKVWNIIQAPNARFYRELIDRVRNALITLRGVTP